MEPSIPQTQARFSKRAFLAEVEAVRHHPRFPEALGRWGEPALESFDGRARDAKLVCQTARYVTLFFILHLNASADPGDPNGGASMARVQERVGASGYGSASWVKLAIRTFHRSGLIEPMPPAADRRLRRFRPSAHLLELGQKALGRVLENVARVRSLPLPAGELARFPGVVENIARVTVDTYQRDGFTNLEILPEITAFLQRDFGHLILSQLVHAMREDQRLGPVSEVPIGDLSERFGISRAHIRNVLQMAEAKGWLSRQSRGGHLICLSPRFAQLCRSWVAIDLAWMHYLAVSAYTHARQQNQAAIPK